MIAFLDNENVFATTNDLTTFYYLWKLGYTPVIAGAKYEPRSWEAREAGENLLGGWCAYAMADAKDAFLSVSAPR